MSSLSSAPPNQNNQGEAESTRIRLLREQIQQTVLITEVAHKPAPLQCPPLPTVPDVIVPNQRSYILAKAIQCPTTFTQPNAPCGAQPVYTPAIPYLPDATEGPQGPGVAEVQRQFLRIRGIDVISKPLKTIPASSRTARIRTGIQVATTSSRYPLTDIPIVPYPQFIPRVGGTAGVAGVPRAPAIVCVPGSRVVG